jgi:AcrR family transcriptional regulator
MASSPPSESAAKARGRRSGDTGERILDAAVETFLANGFDKSSMDAIAERAGVSKTTIYAHHADKFALFRAVMERSSRALTVQLDQSRAREGTDPQERLTEIVLDVLTATTSPDFLAFLRVMITESARHPDLMEAPESTGMVDVLGLLASTLEDEADQRGYELSDSRMFATVLLRMILSGPQLDSLLFADFRPDAAVLEAHARWVTELFLRGVRPRTVEARAVTPPPGGYGYPWLPTG